MNARPITYTLIVQCIRKEIGIIAKYTASTPFVDFHQGSNLELFDCEPRNWDVHDLVQRIAKNEDGNIVCITHLVVDSPVVENAGYIVKKQSGEEIGPSKTRFGRYED